MFDISGFDGIAFTIFVAFLLISVFIYLFNCEMLIYYNVCVCASSLL